MMFLIAEMLACLLIAALLGALVGWLFTSASGRRKLQMLEEAWGAKLGLMEHQAQRLENQFANAVRDRDRANAAFRENEADLGGLRLELTKAQAALSTEQAKVDALEREKQSMLASLETSKEQQGSAAARLADLEERLREREGQAETLAARYAALQQEAEAARAQLGKLVTVQEQLDECRRSSGAVEPLQASLQQVRAEKARTEARLNAEVSARDARISALERQLGELPGLAALGASADFAARSPGTQPPVAAAAQSPHTGAAPAGSGKPPAAPPSADAGGAPDDLKRIRGIGPKLEAILHQLGVYRFRDIANWSERDLEFFSEKLAEFRGRIQRDDWISQARELHESKYGRDAGSDH